MTQPTSSEASSPSSSPSTGSPLTGAQQIVDTLHEPLPVLDRDLRARQVNPAFHRAFGTTDEDPIGRPLSDLGEGTLRHPVLRDALETLLDEREPFEQVELEDASTERGRRVFQVNGRLLDADGKTPERILLVINDITEQRTL